MTQLSFKEIIFIIFSLIFFNAQISASEKMKTNSLKENNEYTAPGLNMEKETRKKFGVLFIPDHGYALYSIGADGLSSTGPFIKPIFSTNEVSNVFSKAFSSEVISHYIGKNVNIICECTGYSYTEKSREYFKIRTATIEITEADNGTVLERFSSIQI